MTKGGIMDGRLLRLRRSQEQKNFKKRYRQLMKRLRKLLKLSVGHPRSYTRDRLEVIVEAELKEKV